MERSWWNRTNGSFYVLFVGSNHCCKGICVRKLFTCRNYSSSMTISYSWQWLQLFFSFCYPSSFIFLPLHPITPPLMVSRQGKNLIHQRKLSGNAIYDWFIGGELEPKNWFLGHQIVLRTQTRSMLLLFLINFAASSSTIPHPGGKSGWLQCGWLTPCKHFTSLKVSFNEEGCLTMMDIATDGLGFMLAFGDLVWLSVVVPITGSLLGITRKCIPLGLAQMLSFCWWTFWVTIFSTQPISRNQTLRGKLKHLKSIKTIHRSRNYHLLTGWWSTSQHINYFEIGLLAGLVLYPRH